jgi:aldehyde dehydrogenase (NAD(P)+)
MNSTAIDEALETLAANCHRWARLPVSTKIFALDEIRRRVGDVAADWVRAAAQAKEIPVDSPHVGEEWTSGPFAVASAAAAFAQTLHRIDAGDPVLSGIATRVMANGQVAVRVFPTTLEDRLLLSGHTADVWMRPGVTEDEVERRAASFYRQPDPPGTVAVVLGAGNIAAIPALDLMSELFVQGSTVVLKFNPVNAYLGPFFEHVFGLLIEGGFVRLIYGGADAGSYLTRHPVVDRIHVTGATPTHDAIVYGTDEAAAARKAADEPIIDAPVTSELGGVGPTIVVGGRWSEADIRHQAAHLLSQKLHNHGFNCVACQILVLPEEWDQADDLLDAMRSVVPALEWRGAYYPGVEERQRVALAAHPDAEILTDGSSPVTLITDLDPSDRNEACFTSEFFGAVLGVVRLPGADPGHYLDNAVSFANETLVGNLGANLIIHPSTAAQHAGALQRAIHALRYGTVAVNSWVGVAFAMTRATWGGYPGNPRNDIGSGNGIVHNALMLEGVERTVIRGPFAPFPRTLRQRVFHAEPLPPYYVTNTNAAVIGRLATERAVTGSFAPVPALLAAALRA